MMVIFQNSHCLQSQSRIHHLISGNKRYKQLCGAVYHRICNKSDSFRGIVLHLLTILFYFIPGTFQAVCPGSYHLCCFRIIAVKDHRYPGFDDPCLFPCNLRDRISQIFYMIKADGSDHTGQRISDRVGGVQSSSKSGLQHNIVNLFFFKDQHTHQK